MTNRTCTFCNQITVLGAFVLLLLAGVARADTPNMTPIVSGPVNATVGAAYDYALSVSNIGNAASRGMVTVTDALAPSLAVNSVSTNQNFICDMAGKTLTCTTKAAIAAGAANVAVATINVTPTAAGAVDNAITVAGGGDASPDDNKTWPITTSVMLPPQFVRATDALAVTTPIPALSPLMLMLLSGLLALGSALALNARKRA